MSFMTFIWRIRDFGLAMLRMTSATKLPNISNSSCFRLFDWAAIGVLEITSIFDPWFSNVLGFISSVTSSNVVKMSFDVAFTNDSSMILLPLIAMVFPTLFLVWSSVMIWYVVCCFFGDNFSATITRRKIEKLFSFYKKMWLISKLSLTSLSSRLFHGFFIGDGFVVQNNCLWRNVMVMITTDKKFVNICFLSVDENKLSCQSNRLFFKNAHSLTRFVRIQWFFGHP